MPSWKKLIVSGSNAILNQITASAGISTSAGLHVTSSNIEMHSDADTKLRIRRNSSTSALELSYRGSTGPLIHSVGKELDISTDTSGISLLPASGIVSINDNSTQGVKPGALSIQKISGINYLAVASGAGSSTEGNIFLITGSNGNVGIANKDPQEKLDVTGNIQASGNISGSATSTGSFGQVDVADIVHVKNLTIRGAGNNVAIGDDGTGESLTEGTYGSVAIGSNALSAHNGSNQNIAIGHNAMKERTAGSDTIAIGTAAGGIASGDVGDKNILIGLNAGSSLDGSGGTYNASSNVYIGYHSGEDATSGLKNTAIGANSGKDLVAGSSNVFLGYYAGNGGNTSGGTYIGEYTTTAGGTTNETVIGNGTIGKGSHTVVLGDDRVTDIYMSEDVGATVHTGTVSGSAISTGSFGAIQSAGNITPKVDDSVDLGAANKRFKNIFTTDLQLSNEGKDKGNEVDGTTGSWTIQEGEEELYLLNRKNGKKYKFMLQEIK